MDLFLDIAGDQIDGARDYQEDAFLTTYIDDDSGGDTKASALIIMADGMGGHAAGNIASNLVVSTFNKNFTGGFGKAEPPELLRDSLLKANQALKESIRETPALDGMGCTMVTGAFSKGKVFWVSVGDSHLYLIRDRELYKQNEDHSYGGYLDRMKAQGVDVEAEAGLSRNMLMSAMTGDDIAEVDCPEKGLQLLGGDRLLIASDGLDTLTPGTIIQTSSWSPTPKECVRALLNAVTDENKPRQDNTTVIVIDVVERSAAVSPPVEEIDAAPAPLVAAAVESAPAAAPEGVGSAAPQPAPSGGKSGLITGALMALLLLGVAAGAYVYLGLGEPRTSRLARAPTKSTRPASVPEEPKAATGAESSATGTETGIASSSPESSSPQPQAPVQPAAPEPPKAEPVTPETIATAPAALPSVETIAAEEREFSDSLRSGGEAPLMVTIPGGRFSMGSGGLSVDSDERPARDVVVGSFAISKYEVTFAQYELFAKATGRKVPDNLYLDTESYPVLFVSWDDAYNYAQWLSKETGERYRLPSEAEWEYAASGGSNGTPYWWGFGLESNRAHCFDCKTGLNPRQPTNVGRFQPNQFGVFDTAGNVFEWVHDCYHANYKGAPSTGGVWEGGDCSYRVARGGAYTSTGNSIRVQKRNRFRSQAVFDAVGIRIARDL